MRLGELTEGTGAADSEASPVAIAGITADSRAVAPGFLFAALAGTKADGVSFVADATGGAARRQGRHRTALGRDVDALVHRASPATGGGSAPFTT